MRIKKLTIGDKKCLDAVKAYINEHGYAPSIREIVEMTGYTSTSTVHGHLNRLFDLGYLESEAPEGTPRAFRLGEKAMTA